MKNPVYKTPNIFKQLQIRFFSFVCIGVIFFVNCSENPFSEENKISQNSISGTVVLENHSDPENVFIWFKVLDVTARTDSSGRFTLNIPSPSKQPGGGLDGVFDLYFYVANYQFKTVKIAMAGGNIQPDGQVLNNNGELKETVVLPEILNINTSFSTRRQSESSVDTIYVTVTVTAIKDPVKIESDFTNPDFPGDPEFMTGFLLNSDKEFVKKLKREDKAGRTVNITVGNSAVSLKKVVILLPQGELQPGDYYIVPYILVKQDLPAGLLESIGPNVTKSTQDFLQYPLKIHNNKLKL